MFAAARRKPTLFALPAFLALVIALVGTSVAASSEPSTGITSERVISRDIPPDLVASTVEQTGGVPLGAGKSCPSDRLTISYEAPGDGWTSGAHVSPLGASEDGRRVNGIVLCKGSHHAYVGFQATLVGGIWEVVTIPDPEGEAAEAKAAHKPAPPKKVAPPPPPVVREDNEENTPDTAPVPAPATGTLAGAYKGPEIEGYARYEGQSKCDPTPKLGTVKLRNVLLAHYPGTSSFGIDRACTVGGRSEHKEGRAFDWGTGAGAANDFLDNKLFATDSYGNKHAMARRMGLMYVIWNKRIWFSHSVGWQPYDGTSPHTDHVHFSLTWAGALGKTSFWSGKVVEGLPSTQGGGWGSHDDDGNDHDGDHHHDGDRDDDDDHDWEPPGGWPKPSPQPTLPPILSPTPSPTIPAPTGTSLPSPTPSSTPRWHHH